MKKSICALVIAALAVPGIAFAGAGGNSCATAQEIFPSQPYSGDTTGGTSFIGAFGILPSPGPDASYKFTSDGQVTTGITVTASFNAAAFLVASCNGNAGSPIESVSASSAAGGTFVLPIDNAAPGTALTAGQTYYVIISGNPSDNSGPSGAYSFTTPSPLPVVLQEFSID